MVAKCFKVCWGFTVQGEANSIDKCLERAFGNLSLFCLSNDLRVQSVRNFTVLNMHGAKGAFPYSGCKGADTITILKWLLFLTGLHLEDESWSVEDKSALSWMNQGCKAGLAFSQGIHGHGLWLKRSCVVSLRAAYQRFGNAYSHLASHCVRKQYTLVGMVPKLHALMHFRTDCDQAILEDREFTLNAASFDCSMSEDFIGRIARQSRRISFRNVEREILLSFQTKAKFAIDRFTKNRWKRAWRAEVPTSDCAGPALHLNHQIANKVKNASGRNYNLATFSEISGCFWYHQTQRQKFCTQGRCRYIHESKKYE